MTTAYIVTEGQYSDYRILKVFLDEELAQQFVKIHNDSPWSSAGIEEYEIEERITQPLYRVEARWSPETDGFSLITRTYADIDDDTKIPQLLISLKKPFQSTGTITRL